MQTIVQTTTGKLEESIQFYKDLEFEIVKYQDTTYALSDHLTIEINTDRYARNGLKLYGDDWQPIIEKIARITEVTTTKSGYLFSAPSGAIVYLENGKATIHNNTDKAPVLGNFAGLSLESTDIRKSQLFWEMLNFNVSGGNLEHGWMSLVNDENFTVSIMKPLCCPHLFFNPSISFFNGEQNLSIIQKINTLDIPVTEEITFFNSEGIVDNIIVRDPGGFGYFIFSD